MDGQTLWDEVSAEFGLKALPCGSTGCQMGGWFNKEINSADDLKGLKMRIPGLGGDVMAKLGASPVSLPGGQIYENLVSGAIDATEWVGPYNDYFMKFYEAAKYYYAAGMHEAGSSLAFGMNKNSGMAFLLMSKRSLPLLAMKSTLTSTTKPQLRNGEYLNKMITKTVWKFVSSTTKLTIVLVKQLKKCLKKHVITVRLAAKVHDSFDSARSELGGWMKYAGVGFSNQRNRVLDI